MPLAGAVLAIAWGLWRAFSASGGAGERLEAFAVGLAWPGALIFGATTLLVWLAWKVELD